MALVQADADALAQLLAESARTLSDGGGEFRAARRPVVGRTTSRACTSAS
jgi:hypothetical protein